MARVVIKHPFRVRKFEDWLGRFKYYVFREDTGEIWNYFESRRDAFEYAYYSNGNVGQYKRELWY